MKINLATLELSTSAFVWLLVAMLKNLTARCQLVLFSSLKGKPLKRAMVADDQKGFVKKVGTERFYGKDHCEGFFFYGSVV
ncbi:hypothetical protein OUZ56_029757 [Daphnia magna]|uniref:Secreted protein n=1 Tax=Daphnia magna TaxID=35525 RepID=A0ABR0B7R5_9CRUS|nr:hypothetical protein OUZ56_029757 [Daphnia magna]